ncbi:MAG: polyprenol monophosphomannose synthase [Bacteroidetes bacterium]|nr:polyprenol monophosphomannose synthase [Bacteroidota bacterium]
MRDCIVIIPTFNEKENIRRMIETVLKLDHRLDILIVDDGSPDGTADIVKSMIAASEGRLHIVERIGKLGLGTAYITGFRWALDRQYEYIFEMDADFSHNPADLIRLREACEKGADMSVGSRYVKGGNVKNWPVKRVLLSYFASVYVRIITWLRVKDTTAGFVCYTRRVLNTMDLDKIQFVGYAFQIEMKFAVSKCRFKIKEVPITFVDREAGTSKMSTGIFKEAFLGVHVMRRKSFLRERYYFKP